ncbi:MAG: inositol monophosphatase family protein [Pseudomonadota bacterium]
MTTFDLTEIVDVANRAADAARGPALQFFRADGLEAENKLASGFDPVTEGDRAVERSIRAVLAEMRPDDTIIGEEYGQTDGKSGVSWIIDPIDGTRAYLCGAPTWGVLVAAVGADDVICGIIDQPFTQERFIGVGNDAKWMKAGTIKALKTRGTDRLGDARLLTTFPEVGRPQDRDGFQAVAENVRLVRYGLDCYGYALLAAGQVDLVIEAGLSNYDIAGPIGVIRAAGGCVTTWDGGNPLNGGQVLASANERLHAAALDLLGPFAG